MTTKLHTLLSALICVALLHSCKEKQPDKLQKPTYGSPNIIYILADDLGYGDLSYTGQKRFTTPHIDTLAKEGMFFSQHYSGSTVCAPSRSTLMTGLHTGHTPIRGNKEVRPEGQWPLPGSTQTLAKLLQSKGYTTGAFGKWGLGYPGSEGDPLKQGFNTFYGYNCQRIGHHYYPYHLWSNDQKIVLEGNQGHKSEQYAPDLIHLEALKFIDNNKDRPFFLYYPSIIPHAELLAPESYMKKHLGKYEPENSYIGTDDGPDYKNGPYQSQKNGHAAFAAMVNLLDDQVGDIVSKIKSLGLADNTIIIFSSDNGPHLEAGADPDYFDSNGPYRGYKRDLYEGGIRVPMIVNWKGKISPGSKTDHISAFWDVLPTIAQLTDIDVKHEIDGISFLPTLLGQANQKQHGHLYWEFHERDGRQALRQGDWKLVRYDTKKNGKYQLYNLKEDPGETTDLAASLPEKVASLAKTLESSRTPSDVFKFEQTTYNAEK
ncbi:arylsulfatase [Seonamhaeicola sp.]|uniref:arylsulfatase n=1 Tax=Seonamhaeicola sp. TaxID=1912245 RepID=UPI0026334FA9|nr:arylsulfatase [Seonamhaeicola sp.]